jgi:hypothetical protein
MSLFQFEEEFADSLHCIPMAVRYKLDRCGIKLKLTHWNRFSQEERQVLLALPGESSQDCDRFHDFLQTLVAEKTGAVAPDLAIDPHPAWLNETDIPEDVQDKASEFKLQLTQEQWQKLQPLQRFALIKLSRSSHENQNFLPALREFKLID